MTSAWTTWYDEWLRQARYLIVVGVGLVCAVAAKAFFGGDLTATAVFCSVMTTMLAWPRAGSILLARKHPLAITAFGIASGLLGVAIQIAATYGRSGDPPHLSVFEAILILVIAPLGESVLFQGLVQTQLERFAGTFLAALATAALFVAWHGHVSPLNVSMGIVLALMRAYYGSLAAVIISHATANATIFLLVELAIQR